MSVFLVSLDIFLPHDKQGLESENKRLAMLSSILRVVYINAQWVAKEYLRQYKSGARKQASDDESLKCWNLERILEAEQFGELEEQDLTMNELLGDLEEDNGGNKEG